VTVQAIPLKDDSGEVAAALLVGTSRAPLLQLQKHIRTIAFGIAGFGILISIGATLWIAAAFSRPCEKLAEASQQVALGEWNAQVEVSSSDELGQLAESLNAMTQQLVEQRGKLVQAERGAAWRELARRLAHELKNPLFPLQITVENLVRAQHLPPEEFNEIFQDSTATLLAELGNLKTIIGRFSDFSSLPKPQLQATSLNELVTRVANLHAPQLKNSPKPISIQLALRDDLPNLELDPDLIYRVISNLVLNAVDAMPEGGTISIQTSADSDSAKLVVSDSGTGLTKEECERLFTPYYTTKQHGTGLGLAIVQSVVSDHHGSITVQSEPGRGTSFVITLPRTQPGSAVQRADGAMA
jgi:nitrogen fixation/metabolism regulation signal transduction histidine kinase